MIGHSLRIEGRDVNSGAGVALTVRDGRIASLRPAKTVNGCWLSPGLVDLQVNGYRGFDLNDDAIDVATVSGLVREMLACGVTTFLPTLVTASPAQLLARLSVIAECRRIDSLARHCIPFVHMEGPHISPQPGYCGAHNREHVRPPSLQEFADWQRVSDGLVGLVTLSPHYPEAESYIRALRAARVHVSLGHTHASAAQIRAAIHAGAAFSTHLGNGIAATIDRHDNPLWTQLAEPRLQAMFIADGHHLPADALKVMLRAKGLSRSILVSDVVALAGMPPGRYTASIGGEVDLSSDGRLTMAGSSHLAGAAHPLDYCIGQAVCLTGLPLGRILRLATLNPARVARQSGSLAPGSRADILQFTWDDRRSRLHVHAVWLAGEPVVRIS